MPRVLNRLAELRKAKGLTQGQLASLVGAHWITISKLERGKIKLSDEWIERIGVALEINPVEILGRPAPDTFATVFGYIEDGGVVRNASSDGTRHGDIDDPERFQLSPYFTSTINWYKVDTDLFEPIIHKGDAIRLIFPSTDDLISQFIGRLIVAAILENGEEVEILCILGRGSANGLYDLRNLHTAMRRDVSIVFFHIVGTIVMQPDNIPHMSGDGTVYSYAVDAEEI